MKEMLVCRNFVLIICSPAALNGHLAAAQRHDQIRQSGDRDDGGGQILEELCLLALAEEGHAQENKGAVERVRRWSLNVIVDCRLIFDFSAGLGSYASTDPKAIDYPPEKHEAEAAIKMISREKKEAERRKEAV